MSVSIDVENVVKVYGKNTVLNGLSLQITPGEFFTLLGPSGCGKTTLLRMIMGFTSIEGGQIKVDDQLINDIPTNKRNMGMVFQNYAVFPHMNVRDNVAYGLKTRRIPKEQRYKQVDEILKLVKIDDYAYRMPEQLSGGQQQRVALARAIVIHPQVLLMDEPLSNLDAKLRVEMRNVIKEIQRKIDITTVYVTHDQEEALAVSDRIAVMNDGVIQQIDTPKRLYQRPQNVFVSTFIGLSNLVPVKLIQGKIDFGYNYTVSGKNVISQAQNIGEAIAAIRPEEWMIKQEEENGIPAKVISSVFLGVNLHYFIALEDGTQLEVISPSDLGEILPDGTAIKLQVVEEKINIFDKDTKATLIRKEV